MKRMLFVLLTLGLFSAAIVGCRAEGEVDVASHLVPGR